MKKLVAMVLTLCLLLSSLRVLADDASRLRMEIADFVIDFPEGTVLEFEPYVIGGSTEIGMVRVGHFDVTIEAYYNPYPRGLPMTVSYSDSEGVRHQIRAQTESEAVYYDMFCEEGDPYVIGNVTLPNFGGAQACLAVNTEVYYSEMDSEDGEGKVVLPEATRHFYAVLYYAGSVLCIDLRVGQVAGYVYEFWEPYRMDEMTEVVQSIIEGAYWSKAAPVTAATAETAGTQEISFPSATIQLPHSPGANLIKDKNVVMYEVDNYTTMVLCYELPAEKIADVTTGDLNYDSLHRILSDLFGNVDAALFCPLFSPVDIDFLGGEEALLVSEESFVIGALYYRGVGIMVICNADVDGAYIPQMYMTVTDILRSLRVNGVTEEEMLADAEKAAATKFVVITADSGKIRGEASISGSLIRTAYKGESFELIREEGDWYVVMVDGRTGYIHKGVSAIQ